MTKKISGIWSLRINDRARGTKSYRAGFKIDGVGRISRRKFATATEAQQYALRLKMRVARVAE